MWVIAILRHDISNGTSTGEYLLCIVPERDVHGHGTAYGNLCMTLIRAVEHLVGILRAERYAELLKNISGSRLHRHVGDGLAVHMHAHALHILRKTVHREAA